MYSTVCHGVSVLTVPCLCLPMCLFRLPNLSTITMHYQSALAPIAFALQLASMRTQLPQLRSLHIISSKPRMHGSSIRFWQQLGYLVQLTSLVVHFSTDPETEHTGCAFYAQDLGQLGGLTRLQKLRLVAGSVDTFQQQEAPYLSFISALTALTALELKLPLLEGLSSISRCCKLQALTVQTPSESEQLGLQPAQALAALTALTSLQLACEVSPDAVLPLYASLRRMRQLQAVRLSSWAMDVLPVFSQLTQLTSVQGTWGPHVQDSIRVVHGSSPHIRRLLDAGGLVPFSALLGLQSCQYQSSLEASAVEWMSMYSPGLQELTVDYSDADKCCFTSLPWTEAVAERLAAVRSLGQLPALRKLCWHAYDDAQITALAAGGRHASALRNLTLVAPGQGSQVTPSSLVQLGKLMQLELLRVEYSVRAVAESEARVLVCGLSDLAHVKFYGSQQLVDVLRGAIAWAAAAGLSVPAKRSYEVSQDDDDDDASLSWAGDDGDD